MDIHEEAEHVIRELIECLEEHIPEKDCRCWIIQAPCHDCVEYQHKRDAVEHAKTTIGRLQRARGLLPVQRY